MRTYSYDEPRFHQTGELFPEEVSDDPWVAYHGTSAGRSAQIEGDGLGWPEGLLDKATVLRVVELFRRMGWCGRHRGGLAVLEPFSLQHDFGDASSKPIYLGEISIRAFTYAKKDFAGGETCRALRHCFDDLHGYLVSDEVRREHLGGRGRRWDAGGVPVGPVDLEWLRRELKALGPVRQWCRREYDRHDAGVVYAVRFDRTDLEYLSLHNSMGIKASRRIAPAKLVAKVMIPVDAKGTLATPEGVTDRWLSRLHEPGTLLGSMKGGW